jgi:hypothetical protein
MNIFDLHRAVPKLPFAAARSHVSDIHFSVVTRVCPDENSRYGKAYGFPVERDTPNDHYRYDGEWGSEMRIPSAGCLDWRFVKVSSSELERLCQTFQRRIAPKYLFSLSDDERMQVNNAMWQRTSRYQISISSYSGYRVYVSRCFDGSYQVRVDERQGELTYTTQGDAKSAALCYIHHLLRKSASAST